MDRTCGQCTACCKTHGIFELSKPPGEWCSNCDIGKGCKVYGNHPQSCKDFRCLWLDGMGRDDEYHPNKINIVFSVQNPDNLGIVFCLWEVEEGALESDLARRITAHFLKSTKHVAHFHLGRKLRFYVAKDKEVPTREGMGNFQFEWEIEIIPFE